MVSGVAVICQFQGNESAVLFTVVSKHFLSETVEIILQNIIPAVAMPITGQHHQFIFANFANAIYLFINLRIV